MEKLLVVEDVQSLRDQLRWGLSSEYTILAAGDRQQGMELFVSHGPKVVLLDLGLPPDPQGTSEGMLFLRSVVELRPTTKVVVMTGTEERQAALQALASGVFDYYVKPIELGELKVVTRRAFRLALFEEQRARLQRAAKFRRMCRRPVAAIH